MLTPVSLCFPGLQVSTHPAAGAKTQREGDVRRGGGDRHRGHLCDGSQRGELEVGRGGVPVPRLEPITLASVGVGEGNLCGGHG